MRSWEWRVKGLTLYMWLNRRLQFKQVIIVQIAGLFQVKYSCYHQIFNTYLSLRWRARACPVKLWVFASTPNFANTSFILVFSGSNSTEERQSILFTWGTDILKVFNWQNKTKDLEQNSTFLTKAFKERVNFKGISITKHPYKLCRIIYTQRVKLIGNTTHLND